MFLKQHLSIGELAKATDTKVETIRYYEQAGCCRSRRARQATIAATKRTILAGLASSAVPVSWDSRSIRSASC